MPTKAKIYQTGRTVSQNKNPETYVSGTMILQMGTSFMTVKISSKVYFSTSAWFSPFSSLKKAKNPSTSKQLPGDGFKDMGLPKPIDDRQKGIMKFIDLNPMWCTLPLNVFQFENRPPLSTSILWIPLGGYFSHELQHI
jgi:hypothetical protein